MKDQSPTSKGRHLALRLTAAGASSLLLSFGLCAFHYEPWRDLNLLIEGAGALLGICGAIALSAGLIGLAIEMLDGRY